MMLVGCTRGAVGGRAVVLAAALLAVAPALSAQAADGRRTIRVVTWEYALFTNAAHDISPDPDNDLCVFLGSIMTCTDLKFAQHETEVRVQASDASGRPVPLEYRLGDAGPELSICGTGSVKLDRAREMSIHTVVSSSCPGLPTRGTVTFTITGRK